ncbi:MAG: HD domain-containing protein [Propionibacteriales bacterium]|nr:HD domain-containing protein [Propionibacteriales bacterium]
MADLQPRAKAWATTMAGHTVDGVVRAHAEAGRVLTPSPAVLREQREAWEAEHLRPGSTLALGAGQRAREEEPDIERTCFERDRDRIVHSTAFRRLAGKTQVVVFPSDHQRTRLTHALEVAQVATSIARGLGVNVALADAIALGHDCGHGPGGHASEDAFDAFLDEGYDHGPWGADVVLTPLNLCAETLDGIRNHSWSRPTPATVEGEIVSWADRIAYCAHDLEDAAAAGIVDLADLPSAIAEVAGRTRRAQLGTFVQAVIEATSATGTVGMPPDAAAALAGLRAFNYERIYTRPESLAQSVAVIEVLRALVEEFVARPGSLPDDVERDPQTEADRVRAAVTYVGGMTDRFAFETAIALLDWDPDRLPKGIGRGA